MSESAAIDYLLDGLAAALELERDLGARTVEVDRSLLGALRPQASSAQPLAAPVAPAAAPMRAQAAAAPAAVPASTARAASSPGGRYDFVFLHDRPLSQGGVEMMAKIILAMGKTAETAPVVIEAPVPPAKIAVALGAVALRKFFPALRGSPGQWLKSADGRDVLVSNSPEEILRFGEVTPAVKRIKMEMWRNLKVVMQRVRQ